MENVNVYTEIKDCVSIRDVKKSRFESNGGEVEYVPQSMERPDKVFNVTFNFARGSSTVLNNMTWHQITPNDIVLVNTD